jgi:hypothetical protein
VDGQPIPVRAGKRMKTQNKWASAHRVVRLILAILTALFAFEVILMIAVFEWVGSYGYNDALPVVVLGFGFMASPIFLPVAILVGSFVYSRLALIFAT